MHSILTILVIFFLFSNVAVAKSDYDYLTQCSNGITSTYVIVYITKDDKVTVNGKLYEKSIIKQKFDELKLSCDTVGVLISLPKGFDDHSKVIKLLDESPIEDKNVTLVQRN